MLPRHMVSSPESVPIFLTYGCSDCHWRYAPSKEETTYSWNAQVLFDAHDCSKFKVSNLDALPDKRCSKKERGSNANNGLLIRCQQKCQD